MLTLYVKESDNRVLQKISFVYFRWYNRHHSPHNRVRQPGQGTTQRIWRAMGRNGNRQEFHCTHGTHNGQRVHPGIYWFVICQYYLLFLCPDYIIARCEFPFDGIHLNTCLLRNKSKKHLQFCQTLILDFMSFIHQQDDNRMFYGIKPLFPFAF